ncbi:MAG: hypothetical protein EZS28_044803, partial [Streblomastix strix]
MEESTVRPDKTAQFGTMTGSDVSTIITHLIQDLESDNINLHVPALRELLNIIVDNHNSKDLTLKYKLMPLLNKFAGKIEKNEEFVLSTTIQHVIGVRNGGDDKTILAGAATDSIIQTIFSSDEQISKAGSKALVELLEENTEIRKSLLTSGFIQIVQHTLPSETLTHSIQLSSSLLSQQKETNVPNYIRNNLLDLLLKLAGSAEDLQPLSILIPILERIKTDGEPELKNKAKRI